MTAGGVLGATMTRDELRTVTVRGVTLTVRRRGSGPDVLFIGGLGNDLTLWDPLIAETDDITAVTVDAPGIGSSSLPPRPLFMYELAAMYRELIEVLGLESATVIGYSFGGAVAQQLAIQSPEAVSRLVLCATGPGVGGFPGDPVALLEVSTPLRYYNIERLRRVTPILYGGMRAQGNGRFRAEQIARTTSPPSVLAYAYQVFALMGWSALPWLNRVRARTLIIAGDDDPIFPLGNAHLMASCIPDSTLSVRPGAGHLLVIDEAPEVGPLVSRFVHGIDPLTIRETDPEGTRR